MKSIGILSDTHGFVDDGVVNFFKDCDEIWHAGDIGNIATADLLMKYKPLKAVYGNIDGYDVRAVYPQIQLFDCEELKVLMIHIGGYPGKYDKKIEKMISEVKPGIFISGHSHILKVIYDKKYNLLHINPGASGKSGFHTKQTAVRFKVEGKDIKDLEIFEKDRN